MKSRRFRNLEEVEKLLNYFFVFRVDNEIIGVVRAEIIKKLSVVDIGPVAVHSKHQVSLKSSY